MARRLTEVTQAAAALDRFTGLVARQLELRLAAVVLAHLQQAGQQQDPQAAEAVHVAVVGGLHTQAVAGQAARLICRKAASG